MKYTTFILLMLVLVSCKTEEWATKKIHEIDYRHPAVSQSFCGNRYPPIVTPSKPQYIQGETDTMLLTVDSVVHDTITNTVTKFITRLVFRTDTIKQTDTVVNDAEIQACETKLTDKDITIAKKEQRIETKNKWLLYLSITLGVFVVVAVIRLILKIKSGGFSLPKIGGS